MRSIDISQFAENGIIQEDSFRQAIENIDWEQYKGKRILIQGCAGIPIPIWAYMMVTAKLAQFADSINYGEVTSPLQVYAKNQRKAEQESV